jgi:hypothetical protein
VFSGNTNAACFGLSLTVDSESALRNGRYTPMRDMTMPAAAVINTKLNKSKQTNGTLEFHRLNNEQLLLNHQQIVRRLTAVIG